MIVVANTKELESKYNLNTIPDNEQILVQGGLAEKNKYNKEKYQKRTTYSGREIKQIIGQMKVIEASIPKEWNQFQKAKYIYEVLGKKIDYNHNEAEYDTQKPSNLSVILSRKGICAGYSLLYKEMMDRQGIQCDYVRGIAYNRDRTKSERHAWNVLTINGQSFPVDLTWDSPVLRRGEPDLEYFGVDTQFADRHIIDQDERRYHYVTFNKNYIRNIDTNPKNVHFNDVNLSQKMGIVSLAIEQTYLRFEKETGRDAAKQQVERAIQRYITTGDASSFTRTGNARDQIKQIVSPKEMLDLMAQSFIEKNYNGYNVNSLGRILESSVNETSRAYGIEHTANSLVAYITQGKVNGFTRTNNARNNLSNYALLPGTAMELMIDTVTRRSIEEIEKDKTIIIPKTKVYFYADELAGADLPVEKKKNVISKAINWIKEKIKSKNNNKNNTKKYSKDENDER